MVEVLFKVDVPSKLESKFRIALEKIIQEFIDELDFSVAKELQVKSRLTKDQADRFAQDVKKGMAKRHGLMK